MAAIFNLDVICTLNECNGSTFCLLRIRRETNERDKVKLAARQNLPRMYLGYLVDIGQTLFLFFVVVGLRYRKRKIE